MRCMCVGSSAFRILNNPGKVAGLAWAVTITFALKIRNIIATTIPIVIFSEINLQPAANLQYR